VTSAAACVRTNKCWSAW